MSRLTHCDGPKCTATRSEADERRFCDEPWLKVEDNWQSFDFHSRECLVAYFTTHGTPNQDPA